MKYIFTFFAAFVIYFSAFSQQVGSKVSLSASDGKTYTGVITEINDGKYKIKYDGFDFDAWLTNTQFTVTETNNETKAADAPPLPKAPETPETPETIPETQPQTNPETQPQTSPETLPQTNPETQPQTTPENVPQTMGENSAPKGLSKGDSIKLAINNIKNAFGAMSKILAGKRDTATITISDIDYDNTNLSVLKENLKKVKGVKSVTMLYKSGSAIMEVAYRGKVMDIWDNLPLPSRSPFKLVDAGEHNILLKQK